MDEPGDIAPIATDRESLDEEPPPAAPAALTLEVVLEGGAWPDAIALEALCARAAGAIAANAAAAGSLPRPALACVAFADDAHVRTLNARYRAKDSPTNVLSFPAVDTAAGHAPALAPGEPRFLGDIVLAAETVANEARDLGLSLDHHVLHLVVHGLLHLVGLDHEDDAEAEAMERLETEILATLGVADPYQD